MFVLFKKYKWPLKIAILWFIIFLKETYENAFTTRKYAAATDSSAENSNPALQI